MKCAILCAAPTDYTPALCAALKRCDLLICADGGYEAALSLGLTPDLLVGDFDSYHGKLPDGVETLRLPVEKDVTDSYVCMEEAVRRGCRELLLTGAVGGRLDHTVANIQHLVHWKNQGVRAVITDGRNAAWVLREETQQIGQWSDTKLSIFSLTECCRGITLRGLKYPLENAALTRDVPLGVSNEFLGGPAEITVREGTLLVVLSYDPPYRSEEKEKMKR